LVSSGLGGLLGTRKGIPRGREQTHWLLQVPLKIGELEPPLRQMLDALLLLAPMFQRLEETIGLTWMSTFLLNNGVHF